MSDVGSNTAGSSASGTLAGGVTNSATSGDTDAFSDTEQEQDSDNGVTDSVSSCGCGGDSGTETYHMNEGGSITGLVRGLEGVYVADSFSGLTGSFFLTDKYELAAKKSRPLPPLFGRSPMVFQDPDMRAHVTISKYRDHRPLCRPERIRGDSESNSALYEWTRGRHPARRIAISFFCG